MRCFSPKSLAMAIAAGLAFSGTAYGQAEPETDGGFRIKAGEFEFRTGGRIQYDHSYMDDAYIGSNADGDGPATDDDRTRSELRRTRIYFAGKVGNNWDYKLQWDVSQTAAETLDREGVGLRDAFLHWNGWTDWFQIILGQYKEPFSLEELTSSNYITTIERSFGTTLFAPSRRQGVGVHGHGDFDSNYFTYHVGGFINAPFTQVSDNEDTYAITGRFSYARQFDDIDRLFHVDVAYSTRNRGENEAEDLSSKFEVNLADRITIATGSPILDQDDRFNIGLAFLWDRWSAQGEYTDFSSDGSSGSSDTDLSSYYILGSVFLTDDSRNYRYSRGVFDKVTPERRGGAWELWIRYSGSDLDDGDADAGNPSVFSGGFNYYVNQKVRFQFGYHYVDLDDLDVEVDGDDEDTGNGLTIRSQIWW